VSKKPKAGGTGGGAKQRPARPQRPQRPKHKVAHAAKPQKPVGASHHKAGKAHHGAGGGGGRTAKRGFTDGIACCAAEALAASLRFQGWPVGDADVVALYRLTADHPDDGAVIEHTLEMAAIHGLAGARLLEFSLDCAGPPPACILGVDWPGQHTVFDDGLHWWSWGIEFEPWAATIEEAWKVRWELPASML
jgi:hypothetical protein